MQETGHYPVGARVLIRDAEWRIKRVDAVKQGGALLTCTGVSNFVKGREAKFLTCFEKKSACYCHRKPGLCRTPHQNSVRLDCISKHF